jgi:peroxiredoxin
MSELLHDVMTDNSLRYSGLDILCRERPHHYIMTMASKAKYIGEEQLPAGRTDHFQMEWAEGNSHRMDLWFSTGHVPLLVRCANSIEFHPEENAKHTISATADLSWKTTQQHKDEEFQTQMPADSIEVADLYSYLADGGTIDLRGQPAPTLDLKTLDGTAWNLEKHKGNDIVVLYFFATWAAPSRQEIPELLEAMQKYEGRSVVFFAVNVGEPAATVQAIANSHSYDRPIVLDPERQAVKSLRVTSLPTVVVIGRDGTIQAAHVGNTAVIRQQIHADLDRLLAGDRLVTPGE